MTTYGNNHPFFLTLSKLYPLSPVASGHLIKAVLFDYGGTLVRAKEPWVEVKPRILHSVYDLLCQNGLDLSYDQYIGINDSVFEKYTKAEETEGTDVADIVKYEELVGRLFPTRSAAWRTRIANRSNSTFWDATVRNFVIRENAHTSLAELRSMDLDLAVVSNHHNPESLAKHLRELRLLPYFSHVFASAQVGFRKPDPRIIQRCLSSLRVNREQAIFVGDSREYDVEVARRAGLRSILVSDEASENRVEGSTGADPDFTINDLGEVPKIVSRIG
jgi:putative hydrolase of the HAD superfamily